MEKTPHDVSLTLAAVPAKRFVRRVEWKTIPLRMGGGSMRRALARVTACEPKDFQTSGKFIPRTGCPTPLLDGRVPAPSGP